MSKINYLCTEIISHMPPISPKNYVYVQMNAFSDELKTKSGVTLYKDTTYNPEWSATLSATALTIPQKVVGNNFDSIGLKAFVKKDDTVLFRYMVVMQWTQEQNANYHTNQHLIDGDMYWKVDYNMILGVIRKGKMIAAPGYIFAKKIEKNNGERVGSLYLTDMQKSETVKNRAVVSYVGEPKKGATAMKVVKGDTVIFNDKFAEKYEIEGEQFLVIRQEYVVGKEL
jgi:co-chaperonin GroES (HSP10)